MSSIVLPPSTPYFECFQVVPLPAVQLPRGFGCTKLFPTKYFSEWEKGPADDRPYMSQGFRKTVLDTFAEVLVSDVSRNQAVFCWRALKSMPVPWNAVYTHFPEHGVAANNPKVAPWFYLQSLMLGLDGLSTPIIPKNDRGAILHLGDAGVAAKDLSGATVKGTSRWVSQISHYAMVGPKVWIMGLLQKENDSSELPKDLVLLTFASLT